MIPRAKCGSLIGLVKQNVHLHLFEILDDGFGRLPERDSAKSRYTKPGEPANAYR